MKYKVGDRIKFNTLDSLIPTYYYEDSDGRELPHIRHGSTHFSREEMEERGFKIVYVFEDIYIVEYVSGSNSIVRLGFTEEKLVPFAKTWKERYV